MAYFGVGVGVGLRAPSHGDLLLLIRKKVLYPTWFRLPPATGKGRGPKTVHFSAFN
jgi:hypothetical protein